MIGKGKLPPLGAPLPGQMKAALAALLDGNEVARRLFAQGAQLEQSRYPLDLSRGIETTFQHLPRIRSAEQFMQLSAVFHAAEHDGKEAANDVLITLGFVRSLAAEPALISQMMRAVTVSIPTAALEHTVNRISLPPESLVELS